MSDFTGMVIGHLGQDPQISTPGGKTVANLSVAVNRRVGSEAKTMWVKVELWNPRPELLRLLKKGAYVRVMGSVFPDSWTGRDGAVHEGYVIRFPQVLVLTGTKADDEGGEAPAHEL